MQLGSQLLPHGQVEAASSPGGPRDEQDLRPAQRGERERRPVTIGQRDRPAARPTAARAHPTRARAPTARAPRRAPAPCRAARRAPRTSSASPRHRASGTQRSALQSPSGLISQPVRARSSSGRDFQAARGSRARSYRATKRARRTPGPSLRQLRTANCRYIMSGHATAGHADGLLLRHLRHHALGGEDVLRDRGRVLQRRARDHRRVDHAGLDEVACTRRWRR